MKHFLTAALVLTSLGASADAPVPGSGDERLNPAERMADPADDAKPIQLLSPVAPPATVPTSEPEKLPQAKDLKNFLKQFDPYPEEPRWSKKDLREVERSYRKMRSEPWQGGDFSKCANTKCPFEDQARECGTRKQQECSPSGMGGRTMCGMAVGKMIECMKGHIPGASSSCNGRCGHGKMFVDCSNHQMETCGYTKVSNPNDNVCKMPGAVLAYSQSPTARGQTYGHVEFVCGRGKYCSVYRQPHDRPWPRPVPDACWFPKSAGGQK